MVHVLQHNHYPDILKLINVDALTWKEACKDNFFPIFIRYAEHALEEIDNFQAQLKDEAEAEEERKEERIAAEANTPKRPRYNAIVDTDTGDAVYSSSP
jgi:hypothetical protein